jgi:4-hydroxythreonine-4-phosphate dehydrogenase
MTTPRLLITAGEPAGIGPELLAALAAEAWPALLVAVGDARLVAARARLTGRTIATPAYDPTIHRAHVPGVLPVIDVALAAEAVPGVPDPRNADATLATLSIAGELCLSGRFDGIVTAPVQKSVLDRPDRPFTGHTEFFADQAGREVVMMLVAGDLRVALATTHLPLAAVPAAITADGLGRTLAILVDGLVRAGIARPRIAVLGLNPHAGEAGHLGREEIDVITPVLVAFDATRAELIGPLPADTAFVPARRARVDAYLAMYHDQGLPVLKALGFGDAVNVTLGLPYVRTSVDHGTALDLAGSGRADPGSLRAATALAIAMARPAAQARVAA